MRFHVLLSGSLILALAVTPCAQAQTATPAPIVVPTLPPNTPNGDLIRAAISIGQQLLSQQRERTANNASGTVTYFERFEMQVRTGQNSYRTVHLHQGTVINPRGGTPSVGTSVTVNGAGQSDGSLAAGTITILQ